MDNLNIGIEKAQEAVLNNDLEGFVAPNIINNNKTDFNDVMKEKGVEEAKKQIEENLIEIKPTPFEFNQKNQSLTQKDIEFLPQVLKDFMTEISRSTQTPLEYSFYFLTSFLSSLFMKKIEIQIKEGYVQPISISVLILAKSGDGKTAIFNLAKDGLIKWEQEQLEKFNELKKEILSNNSIIDDEISKTKKTKASIEEKSKKIKELEQKRLEMPKNPIFRSEDITPEGIRDFLELTDGKLAIIDSEESGFMSNLAGRYSNGSNISIALKGWDGGEVHNFRSGKGNVSLSSININWSIFTQPKTFKKIKNLDDFIHQGFIARTLLVMPNQIVGSRDFLKEVKPIDEKVKRRFDNLVYEILNFEGQKKLFFSKEAEGLYKSFCQYIENERKIGGRFYDEVMGGWVEKLKNNLARMACLIALIENIEEKEVSQEIMQNIIHFSQILINNAESFFGYLFKSKDDFEDIEKEANNLLEKIKNKAKKWQEEDFKKGFTASQLKHKVSYSQYNEQQIELLLSLLIEKQYITSYEVLKEKAKNNRDCKYYCLTKSVKEEVLNDEN